MMEWVTGWVAAGGLLGVFALMFLENIFPPIPSEVIMPLAGFTAAQGHLSLPGVIVVGVIGTVLGNAVWYEAAQWIGAGPIRRFVERYGRWMTVTIEDIDRAERTLKRYGPVAIGFGRLLPGIRTLISVPAGIFLIPRKVFYVWTTLGSTVWIGLLAAAGYLLEDQYHRIEGWIEPLGSVVVVLVVLAGIAHAVNVWRRSSRKG
jgi:membrane protein DedA with SNARE-associated domain